jgi:hypothetical protein
MDCLIFSFFTEEIKVTLLILGILLKISILFYSFRICAAPNCYADTVSGRMVPMRATCSQRNGTDALISNSAEHITEAQDVIVRLPRFV